MGRIIDMKNHFPFELIREKVRRFRAFLFRPSYSNWTYTGLLGIMNEMSTRAMANDQCRTKSPSFNDPGGVDLAFGVLIEIGRPVKLLAIFN